MQQALANPRAWIFRLATVFVLLPALLVIGARYDTIDPEHMEWMANEFPNGTYLSCPDGSHCAHYDDQEVYMDGLIRFIQEVDGRKQG